MDTEVTFLVYLLLTAIVLAGTTIPLWVWMQRRSRERRSQIEEEMQAHIYRYVAQQVLNQQSEQEENH